MYCNNAVEGKEKVTHVVGAWISCLGLMCGSRLLVHSMIMGRAERKV